MLISQLEEGQEGGGQEGGTLRMLRVPDGSMEDMVIPDIMNDVFFTPRKIP